MKIEPSGQKLMEVCVSGSHSPTKLMIVNGGGPRGIRIVGIEVKRSPIAIHQQRLLVE